MNIIKVSDIKISCYEDDNLVWKSLRNQKIKTNSEWKTIRPNNFRISAQNNWHELKKIESSINLSWSALSDGFYLNFDGNNIVEDITAKISVRNDPKGSFDILNKNKQSESILNQVDTSSAPFKFNLNINNLALANSIDANYTVNTTSYILPYMNLSLTNMSFGLTEYTLQSVISSYIGDKQYAKGDIAKTLTFSISHTPTWLKSVTINNNIVSVTCNAATNSIAEEEDIEIICNEYPWMKAYIHCIQNVNIVESNELVGADLVLIEDLWNEDADFDIAFFPDNITLDVKGLGYYTKLTSGSDYFYFGGDITANNLVNSQTNQRNETIILNINKLREIKDSLPEVATFKLWGSFYTNYVNGDLTVSWKLLKNGVIELVSSSDQNIVVSTIPNDNYPNGSRTYAKVVSADTLVSGTTTMFCYSREHEEYPEEVINSLGVTIVSKPTNGLTYNSRPLLEVSYYKNSDKVVVTSLKNEM